MYNVRWEFRSIGFEMETHQISIEKLFQNIINNSETKYIQKFIIIYDQKCPIRIPCSGVSLLFKL